ncbi:MAG: hypothetical protein AAGE98_21700, partial [Actinomycetota bacterium]
MRFPRVLPAIAALVLIAACGGGDDAAPVEPDPPVAAESDTSASTSPTSTTTSAPVDERVESTEPAEPAVEPVTFPLTITDAAGRELTLDGPANIGCIWRGCIEILASLGVAPGASEIPAEAADDSVFYFPVG